MCPNMSFRIFDVFNYLFIISMKFIVPRIVLRSINKQKKLKNVFGRRLCVVNIIKI